jgi:hypothetical protein
VATFSPRHPGEGQGVRVFVVRFHPPFFILHPYLGAKSAKRAVFQVFRQFYASTGQFQILH